MLQYPTNIYPENVAFDRDISDSNSRLSFRFNGDILTYGIFNVFDYLTGELVMSSFNENSDRSAWKYNGEQVEFQRGSLCTGLENGKDYLIQMQLTQSTPDGSANICDMPILRGTVQSNYATSDAYIQIEDGISNIYEWNYNGVSLRYEPTVLYGNNVTEITIKIGNEIRSITSYDKETGRAYLSSAFSNAIADGTRYQLYSNYLISPQYYFKCRKTPVITPTLTFRDGGVECNATYSQAQNSLIKYYTISLHYATENHMGGAIYTSPKIYSQKINWFFPDRGYVYSSGTNDYRGITITVVTQDNMVITSQTIEACPQSSGVLITNMYKNEIDGNIDRPLFNIEFNRSISATLYIYRNNKETRNSKPPELVTVISTHSASNTTFRDSTLPSHGNFIYYVLPSDSSHVYDVYAFEYTSKWIGYRITELEVLSTNLQGKKYCNVGKTWTFTADISNTTITQNTDKAQHIGYGQYSSVSETDVNFMSGEVSGMIGYYSCAEKKYIDTIELVNEWRQFITQHKLFLLKSQKGDVWIVNITGNPTTQYQEDTATFPARFTFSWAECANVFDFVYI